MYNVWKKTNGSDLIRRIQIVFTRRFRLLNINLLDISPYPHILQSWLIQVSCSTCIFVVNVVVQFRPKILNWQMQFLAKIESISCRSEKTFHPALQSLGQNANTNIFSQCASPLICLCWTHFTQRSHQPEIDTLWKVR